MRASRFILVPAFGEGRGTGHLRRMAALARALEEKGEKALIRLDAEAPESFGISPSAILAADGAGAGDLVVFDRFRSTPSDLAPWTGAGLLLGIDEGGKARGLFDYLVDILPGPRPAPEPNLGGARGFLDLPARAREPAAGQENILLSFGGEDRAGLAEEVASALVCSGRDPSSISVIRGDLAGRGRLPGGLRELGPLPSLAGRLGEWDLVLTHYGLTAWEALAAGCSVLILDPDRYHARLTRKAGFPSLGVGKKAAWNVGPALKNGKGIAESCVRLWSSLKGAMDATPQAVSPPDGGQASRQPRSGSDRLASFLASLELSPLPGGRRCVCCAAPFDPERQGPSLWRDGERTYRRCPACGAASLLRLSPSPIEYRREYFFEEYRAQYGKTYLEDFPALRAMAGRRLEVMERLMGGKEGASVLDVGCAYGAFLLEAKGRGYRAVGLDPAPDAVEYVKGELGIPAFEGSFPDRLPAAAELGGPFDAVTLWYVIEHLADLPAAFAAIGGILKPGGILAFSTPSSSGVSGRFSPDDFWKASPADHMAVLDPESVGRVCAAAGFRVLRTVSTGHHPERFPGKPGRGSPAYAVLGAASRAFALGDTFEAYAVKAEG